MSQSWYLGIDPGVNGALACIKGRWSAGRFETTNIDFCPMPKGEKPLLRHLFDHCRPPFADIEIKAVVEKVGGYRADGEGNIGSAMFTFGENYGAIKMGLVCAGIPFDEVHPLTWQALFSLKRKKTQNKTAWKNTLRRRAAVIFPQLLVSLNCADALLIAEYCRIKAQEKRVPQ